KRTRIFERQEVTCPGARPSWPLLAGATPDASSHEHAAGQYRPVEHSDVLEGARLGAAAEVLAEIDADVRVVAFAAARRHLGLAVAVRILGADPHAAAV